MQKTLSPSFFDRPVLDICPDLLGKFLLIKNWAWMITEIEAYDWTTDLASHARHWKTIRNAPMFWDPGHRYIYMIYGMYNMLNIVTWPGNYPSTIFIRGVEWFQWPWKLTKNLEIDKSFNGKIANQKTWLWIEDRNIIITNNQIVMSPRTWIDYAWDYAQKSRKFTIKT